MTSAVTAQLILIQGDGQHFQRVIELSNTNVSIGRAQNCNVVWGSLQISRQHASLEYVISKWFIRDTSTNGLSVNGNKLVKGELSPLNDLDIISFIPTGTVRYRFKYASSVSAPYRPNTSLGQNNNLISPLPAFPSTSRSYANAVAASSSSSSSRNGSFENRISSSVEVLSSDNNHSDSEDSNHSESLLSLGNPEDYLYGYSGDDQSPAVDPESSEEGAFVAKRKHNEDSSDSDSRPTDRKKKKIIVSSSEDESSKDDSTKADFPNSTSTFKFKQIPESTMMSDEQVNKCNDIEALKAQLKSYIFKAGKAEAQLEVFKMDRNIEREEFHKKEKEAESSNTVFKEETYKNILELMESELSCSVCNEIFIQATVIECGHTFCGFCIAEWSRKKQECPICRKRFTSRCRHIEVENFIIKMFESFNEEIAAKRQASILDRENQVKRAEEEAARAQTAHQNRGTGTGGNFHAFIQSTAERYVDFLAELHQINEILAPRPNSARGGAAGSDRRRSARIQERVVGDGVAPAGEQGTGGRRRGRRLSTRHVNVALPNPPPPIHSHAHAAAVRIEQLGRVSRQHLDVNARIPIVTLDNSTDNAADGIVVNPLPTRFPNHLINYVRRIPMNLNMLEVPANGTRNGARPNQ